MTAPTHILVRGAPPRPATWVRFVVRAATFLAIALLLTETFWRSLGYLPAGSDVIHFAKLRKAADGDRRVVALVGSSRVRHGLNPHALDAAVPGKRFLQLGILGNSAMPVLEDLANDPGFTGMVLCEFNPPHWSGTYPFTKLPEALAYTHPEVSGAYLEMLLGEQFHEHFSFYSYNLVTELPRILQHKPIPPVEQPDRFIRFDDLGSAINTVLIRNWSRVAQKTAEDIKHDGPSRVPQEVAGWVERIRRRGGDVAFVRMPVDGELRTVEDSAFPQTQSLIRDLRARGIVVIDFAQMPEHFRCPDGSHLQASEADRFSRLVGEALTANRFFRDSQSEPTERQRQSR